MSRRLGVTVTPISAPAVTSHHHHHHHHPLLPARQQSRPTMDQAYHNHPNGGNGRPITPHQSEGPSVAVVRDAARTGDAANSENSASVNRHRRFEARTGDAANSENSASVNRHRRFEGRAVNIGRSLVIHKPCIMDISHAKIICGARWGGEDDSDDDDEDDISYAEEEEVRHQSMTRNKRRRHSPLPSITPRKAAKLASTRSPTRPPSAPLSHAVRDNTLSPEMGLHSPIPPPPTSEVEERQRHQHPRQQQPSAGAGPD